MNDDILLNSDEPGIRALRDFAAAERGVVVGDMEQVWAGMSERVSRLKGADAMRKRSGFGIGGYQLKNWGRWLSGVGALTITLMIAAVVGINYIDPVPPNRLLLTRTYITANAQRLRVTLPDGSLMTLAPATRVHYTGRDGTRSIDVNGEAYFEVQHSSRSSFSVHASGINTKVLGTRFIVRKYDSDATIRVIVTDGRVSVSRAGVLNAGDLTKVSPAGEVSIIRNADVALYTGWLEGKSTYVNIPLRELIPEIERTYDLSVTVADPETAELPVTTTLATQASPNEILRAIASSLSVRVTRVGRNVTFAAR